MEIEFVKKDEQQHILVCRRSDGTTTWRKLDPFFLRHDLIHYAVESVLRFKGGFYGMVARGIDITDFDLPRQNRTVDMPVEAIMIEHIVNLVMVESREGRMKDFNAQLRQSLPAALHSVEGNWVSNHDLDNIHSTYEQLYRQWQELPEDDVLSLHFEA